MPFGLNTNIVMILYCAATTTTPPSTNRHFEAIDAKTLRVAISSFYDFLTVSLKCFQEFDEQVEQSTS